MIIVYVNDTTALRFDGEAVVETTYPPQGGSCLTLKLNGQVVANFDWSRIFGWYRSEAVK